MPKPQALRAETSTWHSIAWAPFRVPESSHPLYTYIIYSISPCIALGSQSSSKGSPDTPRRYYITLQTTRALRCMEPHGHNPVSLLHPRATHPQECPRNDSLFSPRPTRAPTLTLSSIPADSLGLSPPTSSMPYTRSSQDVSSPAPTNIRYRSHPQRALACLHCRRSKVKCDKKQPTCTR